MFEIVGGGRSTFKSSNGGSFAFEDNSAGGPVVSMVLFLFEEDDDDDEDGLDFSGFELLADDDCLLDGLAGAFDVDAVGSIMPRKSMAN